MCSSIFYSVHAPRGEARLFSTAERTQDLNRHPWQLGLAAFRGLLHEPVYHTGTRAVRLKEGTQNEL